MLNPSQVLLQGFTVNIRQWIAGLCGDSIVKESLVTIGIGTVSYLIGGQCNSLCNFIFKGLSQIMYNSAITGCVDVILEDSKEWIGDRLDTYGYDEYINYFDPLLDISAAIALRQIAGLTLEWNMQSAMSAPMPLDSQPLASTSSSILTKISSGLNSFFNLGKSTQANQPNILSQACDFTADYMFLSGTFKLITNISTSIYQYFSGNKSELSVYDIKNILKAQIPAEEYNRAAVTAQAEQIMANIQQADNYYKNFESKPDIQKNIDMTTNLYLKNIGAQLKTQYASTLANNPQLIEKSELLLEKLMELEVINRLMSARTTYAQIQEIKVMNILPDFITTESIKKFADIKLTAELKLFSDATAAEQANYKNLFGKAAMIEVEYEVISYMLQDNLQNELAQMESYAALTA